ncbi:DUF5329 domain-containing protein [Leptospira sp. 2 VSF19]|uniref:DUF5329 domain-containing protein n=1 Tax=Leptospira soteropolitanensis TaxID=2950025 RepID=A0AAW5VJ96_9LEPT|nr:DUF5329 family protein [Leptospira soteropolitanensis]MCW7491109.1 DUF5329 domain-containing protein [Leptospira soteropolitanensis]MCW7498693.1 DUF5329 domain-containing protein [Leptospira soteropolitanensis]MCW7521714.1 DUF5329 domain-containing protein [Leptospira soteropolitanensis]MCW7524797.1 DUF5329 domain-containing protein [Leptospira soteropolitanensis]MCW7528664.1 DUF5329 domain-containing protein [Leptospira soteropolitanensis]
MKSLRPIWILFFISFELVPVHSYLYAKTESCNPLTEEQKIEKLLKKVGKIQGNFIRNGDSHTPAEAEKHLRYKLEEAKNSFFAPDPKDWTAKLFIEKIASKSFLTGTPYRIQFSQGKELFSADWLFAELAQLENCK